MLSILADTQIFLSVGPTDMRKGFDGVGPKNSTDLQTLETPALRESNHF